MNSGISLTFFSYFLLLLSIQALQAQTTIESPSNALTLINIDYNGSMAGGDFADRFGFTSSIGVSLGYKFKSNWYTSIGGRFLFGGTVKEDNILDPITTAGGLNVIADNGNLIDVKLQERGWLIPFTLGKIFTLNPSNQNSGIYVELGGQFIEHKILIQTDDVEPASLSKEHKKGYDRLTNGFGIREGVGYRFFDNRNYINFAIGIEFSQNFTQNRRRVDFDTGLRDDRNRMDLLGGLRATWTIPITAQAPRKIYYN